MWLIDTNVLSEVVRPKPNRRVIERLLGASPARLFASELTRFELRRGACLRETEPDRRGSLWSILNEQVVPLVRWVPLDTGASMLAGQISAGLRKSGIEIGIVDTLLAATAVSRDLTMVTRNTRHFDLVEGLTVENWFDP